MNITVQNTKSGKTYSFDTTKLPQATLDYWSQFAAQQTCSNSHASVTKEAYPDEAARKVAADAESDAWYQNMLTGQVRATRGPKVDPARAAALARGWTNAQIDAALAGAPPKSKAA